MANLLNGSLQANEFELQLCYYVHFRTSKGVTVMADLLNGSLQANEFELQSCYYVHFWKIGICTTSNSSWRMRCTKFFRIFRYKQIT